MPIAKYNKWISDTKRFWTRGRSDELVSIDNALLAYEKSKTVPNLIKLKKAVDAFVADKGTKKSGRVDSKRDSKGHVLALKQAIDAELGGGQVIISPLAPATARQALRPMVLSARPASFHTMDDDDQLTAFAHNVKLNVFPNWNNWNNNQRAVRMHAAATAIHTACGVPTTTCEAANLGSSTNGLFQFSSWKLQLNETMFGYDLNPANVDPYFVWVAEIVYHEARHAEQWYHMARYEATGKDQNEAASAIWHTLGMHHMPVCTAAWNNRMGPRDPLLEKTKAWYSSVYGGPFREITLGKLGLKRTTTAQSPVNMDDFHRIGHSAYKGQLAEEVDAWGIQDLLRAKF